MIFFHQVCLVDLLIREPAGPLIPAEPAPAAEAYISHLRNRRHMGARRYRTSKVFHPAGPDHLDEVSPMVIQTIVNRLRKRLAHLVFALAFFDHFPTCPAKHQRTVVANKSYPMVPPITAIV